MTADPKPVKRHKADPYEWSLIRKLKGGPCRICLHLRRRLPLQLHHLVGRDLGGDDKPDNLVPLCVECHQAVEEREPTACHLLRASLTLREYAYVIDKKGVDFLNRYYPRRSAEDMSPSEETPSAA